MVLLPQIHINVVGAHPRASFFSFLFVTVSSRITGQIGSSSNPISGMTVATLLLTSLMFLAVGWVGIEYRVLALSIGGVVCVAAATAGATSQDLKTGFLVGATPSAPADRSALRRDDARRCSSAESSTSSTPRRPTIVCASYPGVAREQHRDGARTCSAAAARSTPPRSAPGRRLRVGHLYEQTGTAPAGKYLVDDTGAIRYLVDPGLGGRERVNYDGREIDKLESPKAQIMALVVDGILTQKLPWGLILIGAFLAVAMELVGIPSLAGGRRCLPARSRRRPRCSWAACSAGSSIDVCRAEEREGADADSGPGVSVLIRAHRGRRDHRRRPRGAAGQGTRHGDRSVEDGRFASTLVAMSRTSFSWRCARLPASPGRRT